MDCRGAVGRARGAPDVCAVDAHGAAELQWGQRRENVEGSTNLKCSSHLRFHAGKGYCFSGTAKTNVLPLPLVDSTVRSPSCIRAISLESHRPRPVPWTFCVFWMRPNRVNRLAWSCGLIPTPWSM